jgi:RND family efflux transporter MFP subunit
VVFDESRTSRLGAPLAGRVSAVFAERGQEVKAGAPLYSVSSPNLADMQAAVKLAEVDRDTARKNYERTQRAVDAQVLAGKELVDAKQKLDEAEVAVKAARQKLASLRVSGAGDAASFTVVAPRAGVVVERTVAVGQTVSPDSGSLIAIADLSDVWVVADIFGAPTGLAVGSRARVVIGNGAAAGDREGRIDQIAAVIDPGRHAVPVRIRLDNTDGLLRPNAYVQVRLFDPTPTTAMLPAAAVMSDGHKSFVYIEAPTGTFKRRDIEVGSVFAGRVPVTAGLAPTDRVVVTGAILIDNQIALTN